MPMFCTVSVAINLPDGTPVVLAQRQDTSISALNQSADGEMTMAEATVLRLANEVMATVSQRCNEVKGLTDGIDRDAAADDDDG